MRKLCDRRGETLAETLCAVLVLSLAVALLAGMIAAASRLDRKTDQATAALYNAFSGVEKQASGTSSSEGEITVQIGDETPKNVNVEFYGDAKQMVSYQAKAGGGTP